MMVMLMRMTQGDPRDPFSFLPIMTKTHIFLPIMTKTQRDAYGGGGDDDGVGDADDDGGDYGEDDGN